MGEIEVVECPVSQAVQVGMQKINEAIVKKPDKESGIKVWDLAVAAQILTGYERLFASVALENLVIRAFQNGGLDMVRLTGGSGDNRQEDVIYTIGTDLGRQELIELRLSTEKKTDYLTIRRIVDAEMQLRKTERKWIRTLDEQRD